MAKAGAKFRQQSREVLGFVPFFAALISGFSCHFSKEWGKKNAPINDTRRAPRHALTYREILLRLKPRGNFHLARSTAVAAAFIKPWAAQQDTAPHAFACRRPTDYH